MAIKLLNKTNVTGVSSAYPYGNIKDDGGTGNGTPVDVQVYGDIHQFFERMMAMAKALDALLGGSFDFNNLPDNQTNSFQFYAALTMLAGMDVWRDGGNVVLTGTSDFVVQTSDVSYNRYKVVGKTLYWQLRIQSATIANAPTALTIELPPDIVNAGTPFNFANNLGVQLGVYNQLTPLFVKVNTSTTAVDLALTGNAAFTNGTNNQQFDIALVIPLS